MASEVEENNTELERNFENSVRVSVLLVVKDFDSELLRCLKSLSNQILDDMEVLCLVVVPENETEAYRNQLVVLEDYAKKDPRIRIVRTKMTDYGVIMNAGVKISRGEYINIISVNDFVDPEMYIELFALAKKHDADVVRSNYYEFLNDADRLHESFLAEDADKLKDPEEDTSIFYQPPILGCGLYKREFILGKQLSFINSLSSKPQDASYNFKLLASTDKLVLTNKAYIHYQENNSIIKSDEMYLVNLEYAETEKFLKARGIWDTYGNIFEAVKFASYFLNMLRLEDKNLEPFILRTRAEFHDADDRGKLKKKYFPKEHWKTLQGILKYPPSIFLLSFKKYRKK